MSEFKHSYCGCGSMTCFWCTSPNLKCVVCGREDGDENWFEDCPIAKDYAERTHVELISITETMNSDVEWLSFKQGSFYNVLEWALRVHEEKFRELEDDTLPF